MSFSATFPRHYTLQQITELDYILLGDLRDVLHEEMTEQTRKWLIAIVETLLKTVPEEFRLREQGGYLEHVLECRPTLNGEVQKLRLEHATLVDQLKQLETRLVSDQKFCDIAEQLRHDLQEWSNAVIAHHRHETRLSQSAINTELGGGD